MNHANSEQYGGDHGRNVTRFDDVTVVICTWNRKRLPEETLAPLVHMTMFRQRLSGKSLSSTTIQPTQPGTSSSAWRRRFRGRFITCSSTGRRKSFAMNAGLRAAHRPTIALRRRRCARRSRLADLPVDRLSRSPGDRYIGGPVEPIWGNSLSDMVRANRQDPLGNAQRFSTTAPSRSSSKIVSEHRSGRTALRPRSPTRSAISTPTSGATVSRFFSGRSFRAMLARARDRHARHVCARHARSASRCRRAGCALSISADGGTARASPAPAWKPSIR